MSIIVLNGDNIELLKQYPDNYFDSIVTDPPYGLGKEPNAAEVMKGWVEKGYHEVGGSGFMGKEWDAFIPQPIFWKEVFRVLKHGGHVLSFFGSRTYDWGVMAMRFAEFEVRDTITWHFGSGFPKSHNISKSIDKLHGAEREIIGITKGMGKQNPEWNGTAKGRKEDSFKSEFDITAPSTEKAKQWEGWGSALKPASEYIVLARKPLEKGLSIAENVLKWGTGGINIDGSRIGLSNGDDKRLGGNGTWKTDKAAENVYEGGYEGKDISSSNLGRFPANLILQHSPMCQLNGLKKVKGNNNSNWDYKEGSEINNDIFGKGYKRSNPNFVADENGEETIEDWTCDENCPIRIMDEQSGILKSGDMNGQYHGFGKHGIYGKGGKTEAISYGDTGGASRFFYCAKASKSERNKGLEGFEEKESGGMSGTKDKSLLTGSGNERNNMNLNFHPTVKPIKLMQYLVRLITPPNGKVLDPFCGSGTTGIACKLEGFEFVGLEQDAEYCKIAQARIDNYEEEPIEPLELIHEHSNGQKITQTSLF
jgi:site-specific DNA-methyltransferase (adenine-specific)